MLLLRDRHKCGGLPPAAPVTLNTVCSCFNPCSPPCSLPHDEQRTENELQRACHHSLGPLPPKEPGDQTFPGPSRP